MDISIIIVNYRSELLLCQCLESLYLSLGKLTFEVIIVNNEAGALKNVLAKNLPNLKIVANSDNDGFAKACNKGAGLAQGRNLFFLNPDTQIVSGDLAKLFGALEDPSVGVAAPLLTLPTGEIQPWSSGSAVTFWSLIKNKLIPAKLTFPPQTGLACETGWVSGAALAISHKLFKELGGFDENFFMYFEDADLCRRVNARGLKILMVPNILILHLGGQSYANESLTQKTHYYLSQDYYFKKNFSPLISLAVRALREPALFIKKIATGRSGKY